MDSLTKNYQGKFREVREKMSIWDELQTRLLLQFQNASAIIGRLQVIQNPAKYGALKFIGGIENAVTRKQMETLENIFNSMKKTIEEFHGIVVWLEKNARHGKHLIKGGSIKATPKQLQQRIGLKPSIADCLDGLQNLHEMHLAEYSLKTSIVTTISDITLKLSASDLNAMQKLLSDQPNIPKEEGMHTSHRFSFNFKKSK
ncbi:uncharacterized protein At5g43822 [Impatiens glandulifera]|uniref:uncharacterized protein At5g43822 n=1 Tax=Impatiens glandulifera TaxID=253017 RepID=UPI001FB060DF|nr:uncharacterized protein At5g43822 [Impatiens glandulifera]